MAALDEAVDDFWTFVWGNEANLDFASVEDALYQWLIRQGWSIIGRDHTLFLRVAVLVLAECYRSGATYGYTDTTGVRDVRALLPPSAEVRWRTLDKSEFLHHVHSARS